MAIFDVPASDFASRAVQSVTPETRLPLVDRMLAETGVSGIPVVDGAMRPLGVITRTDLLQAGAVPAVTGSVERRMIVPDRRVSDLLQGTALSLPFETSMAEAVALMRDERVHRVLLTDAEGKLAGLVSVWDAMRAVARGGTGATLDSLMSSGAALVSVTPEQNADSAVERLRNAHVHGLIVIEDGWPLGVFGQLEALQAERWPEPTTVESWFDPAVLVLPPTMRAPRAAAQAVAMHSRHIVVMDETGLRGLVTASDFLNAR